jgi:ankyrin repeat protein
MMKKVNLLAILITMIFICSCSAVKEAASSTNPNNSDIEIANQNEEICDSIVDTIFGAESNSEVATINVGQNYVLNLDTEIENCVFIIEHSSNPKKNIALYSDTITGSQPGTATVNIYDIIDFKLIKKITLNIDYQNIFQAAENGNLKSLNKFIDREDDIDSKNENGETALYIACEKGFADGIKALLEAGADPNIAEDKLGLTPVMILFFSGFSKNLISLMVDYGADLKKRANNQDTILDMLIIGTENAHALEKIKYAIELEPELLQSYYDQTIYIKKAIKNYATKNNSPELLNYLFSKGIDINIKLNSRKDSILHYLNSLNHISAPNLEPAIRYLVSRGLDIDTRDYRNRTSLHCAVINNNYSLVKYLLDNGANKYLYDAYGKDVLQYANNSKMRLILSL